MIYFFTLRLYYSKANHKMSMAPKIPYFIVPMKFGLKSLYKFTYPPPIPPILSKKKRCA